MPRTTPARATRPQPLDQLPSPSSATDIESLRATLSHSTPWGPGARPPGPTRRGGRPADADQARPSRTPAPPGGKARDFAVRRRG